MLALGGCGGNVSGPGGGGAGAGANGGAGGGVTTSSTASSSSTSTPSGADLCTGPGQCVLAFPGCCPPCGMPEVRHFEAVNEAFAAEYAKAVCPEPTPCPECETLVNPNLFAHCDGPSTCAVADVRTHAVSACTTDADCRLRVGAACCESCIEATFTDLTAVSNTADPSLEDLVCEPGTACPPCLPTIVEEVYVYCAQDGHCRTILPED